MLLYYLNVSVSLVVMALSISAVPESEKHPECLCEKNAVLLKCIYIHTYSACTHTPRACVCVCVCVYVCVCVCVCMCTISVHYCTQLPVFFHWQSTHHVCRCSSSVLMNNRWLQYSKNQRRCNDRWMFHAAIRSLCERRGYLHACLQSSATTILCQRPVHLSCAYTFSPERHFFLPYSFYLVLHIVTPHRRISNTWDANSCTSLTGVSFNGSNGQSSRNFWKYQRHYPRHRSSKNHWKSPNITFY